MASLVSFIFYILLTAILVCYPHTEARSFDIKVDRGVMDNICKQSQDSDFCQKTLVNDPRSATATMDGLALIAISDTIIQLQSTLNNMPGNFGRVNGSIGEQRRQICQSDYQDALGNFQRAYGSSNAKAYYDVINWVRDGTNKVIDCENIYKRSAPITTSPITVDNHNVIKLSEIILIIVDSLLPH